MRTTTRIGRSGDGSGGGIVPVNSFCCSTTVSGTSTILVADTFIPFCRPQASVIWPSMLNFWPSGILNAWLVPSSKVRMTELGGFTYHTVPVTLFTVVMVCGVVVVVMVRSSVMPGFRS